MKRIFLLGAVMISVVSLILTSFPSVVGYQATESTLFSTIQESLSKKLENKKFDRFLDKMSTYIQNNRRFKSIVETYKLQTMNEKSTVLMTDTLGSSGSFLNLLFLIIYWIVQNFFLSGHWYPGALILTVLLLPLLFLIILFVT
jgi:uncharacterized membrane protein